MTMKLNLHRLALLLSLASQPPPGAAAGRCPHRAAAAAAQQQLLPTPLLELAATALTMDVHDVGVGWLEATVATHLQLDVFSSSKQGWEPVLEPWQCRWVGTGRAPGWVVRASLICSCWVAEAACHAVPRLRRLLVCLEDGGCRRRARQAACP